MVTKSGQPLEKKTLSFRIKVTYILFAIYIILYAAFSLTIIQLQIFPTINRITYFDATFNWTITGSIQVDILIASILFAASMMLIFRRRASITLSSIVLIASLLPVVGNEYYNEFSDGTFLLSMPFFFSAIIVDKIASKKKNTNNYLRLRYKEDQFNFQQFPMFLFYSLIVLEGVVFFRWLIHLITKDFPANHWSWNLTFLENNLFYAFGLLSSALVILCVFQFLIQPNTRRLESFLTKYFRESEVSENDVKMNSNLENRNTGFQSRTNSTNVSQGISVSVKQKRIVFLVFLFVLLSSSLVSLYPYFILVEDGPSYLGTDIPLYLNWLEPLETSEDITEMIHQAFFVIHEGSRPLTLFFIYASTVVSTQTDETVLKYMPTLLGPLLALSVYFLSRTAYPENRKIALIAAIMTVASHQIVIGFYAAFYANWLALVTMYLSTAFLLRSLRAENVSYSSVLLFFFFNLLTLLFHSFTWSYFTAIVVLFLAWSGIKKRQTRKHLKLIVVLAIATGSVIAIDGVKSYYSGYSISFVQDLNIPADVGFDEFRERWRNLASTFTWYLGGFLVNSALLALLFLWTIKANYKNDSDRFFLSMLFVSLLPILFGDYVVQSRIFYNIPFQILGAVMMYRIYKSTKILFGKPLVIVLFLMQFNYALRAMANMNFVPPGG